MQETDKKKPLAIVIGRNYTTRLTLARSAGMIGCDVVLIQTDGHKNSTLKIDRSSQFVVDSHFCPEPYKNQLIDVILSYKNVRPKVLLVPADDYAASVIDSHLEMLSESFLLPHVNYQQGGVLRIMDKAYQKSLALSVGFHVAKGWIATYSSNEYTIPEGVTYPCFTKPLESYDGALKNYLKKCSSEKELKELLAIISKSYHLPILIEEFVKIDREYGVQGVSFATKSVCPSVVFKESSLRGLTATGYISPISKMPGLQKKIQDFMKETCFTGIFDIDLFESDGQIYFNELNVRLGANGFALTYGVFNVPGIFMEYQLGRNNGEYNGPEEFASMSFASEKVLREMYYDKIISFKDYKRIRKDADVLSLKYQDDNHPYQEFVKLDVVLPLWSLLRDINKKN